MGLYNTLFYETYRVLYAIKGNSILDTAESVATSSSMLMAIFPFLNLIALDPEVDPVALLVVTGAIVVFNYILFVSTDRYLLIVKNYKSKPNTVRRVIVVLYILFTIVLLVARKEDWFPASK